MSYRLEAVDPLISTRNNNKMRHSHNCLRVPIINVSRARISVLSFSTQRKTRRRGFRKNSRCHAERNRQISRTRGVNFIILRYSFAYGGISTHRSLFDTTVTRVLYRQGCEQALLPGII